MSEQYVRVPRELLERVETWVQADCQALTELQALLSAPAEDVRAACRNDNRCQQAIEYGVEGMAACPVGQCAMQDVRAVGEEPVAWRGCNSDGEVVTEWIDGAPPEKMFDLCGNAASFDKIERAYSHPQRPVVMPEIKTVGDFGPEPFSHLVAAGWNACIDEFARLNK